MYIYIYIYIYMYIYIYVCIKIHVYIDKINQWKQINYTGTWWTRINKIQTMQIT